MHPFFFRFFNINAIKEKNDKDRECETAPSIQAESSEDKDSLKVQTRSLKMIQKAKTILASALQVPTQ